MREKIIVVGSGLAGLFFALEISKKFDVLILTKKEGIDANTNYAQGGIAAVHGKDDSFDIHYEDTLRTGEGLCNEEALKIMVEEGPELVRKLFSLGVEFSLKGDSPDLWLEGGHSRRRIWHSKDSTGNAIEKTLIDLVKNNSHIELREKTMVIDLICEEGRCKGVEAISSDGKSLIQERSDGVMMASGGIGQVYEFTTNPKIATGDGIAIAYRAGADICNMEFIQFHPTSLYEENKPEDMKSFLISEAVRGEGAVIKSLSGADIMKNVHSQGSLAPRDIVARAIQAYLFETKEKYVVLDASKISRDRFKNKFPHIYSECIRRKVDLRDMKIPVVPAAHYICGGIKIDMDGRTHLPGLFASGEAAFSGVHGANRLASNSLLEALVFSNRAAKILLDGNFFEWEPASVERGKKAGFIPDEKKAERAKSSLQKIMWDKCGIVRDQEKLEEALREIREMKKICSEKSGDVNTAGAELVNMLVVSEGIVLSAISRKESRGLHFRRDMPRMSEEFARDTVLSIRKEE
ncbi:L-aspartate oxidase [candidate division WOR-3 bacterium]|nr:L-aspartate oxidase [candidate division WOR-3 bacterium]